jgi:hypothetical protein
VKDISGWDISFRGYPVTLASPGVAALLPPGEGDAARAVLTILAAAVDTAEPDEPSGWIFESSLDGEDVWVERFGGMRETDRHEGGKWSVYLPGER